MLRRSTREALVRELTDRAARSRSIRASTARSRSADLIIYAPGTQHSSLFPSYLTPGLSDAIAANLKAIKLLVTNIQSDAEITGSSAVDIIERAVYYLKEKGRLPTPTPCLITHYLLNDPQRPRAPRRTCRSAGWSRWRIRGWSGSGTTRRASRAATMRRRSSAHSSSLRRAVGGGAARRRLPS